MAYLDKDGLSYFWGKIKDKLSKVAFSGSYNDLSNKPSIPSAVTESTVSGWGFTKNTGTYSKPSTGIPKTDLASAVQTSLGKADTALQSFTEKDPTVPSWAKASSKPSYTTGEIGLTDYTNGTADNGLRALLSNNRANRLAFLPSDQIIIEKTTDGGKTWTSYGADDGTKLRLFSEVRQSINIPLDSTGKKNINCGVRVTFTAMKYNVPSGTAETSKYNYWNSNYVASTERYCQLFGFYFWVSSNSDKISVKCERATGAASTTWNTVFDSDAKQWAGMSGWSGNDWISIPIGVFGGGTGQTTNFWNYRLTFFTRPSTFGGSLATTYQTSAQSIAEIRGYGDTWWNKSNEFMASDHMYSFDENKNVTFPNRVNATSFNGYTIATSVPSNAKFTDTTYSAATQSVQGLMSADDKKKLDGIASGANNYSLPTASASVLGGIKVGTNLSISNGVLSATNTTYSDVTTSAHGLMTAADKTKLNGISTGANKVTLSVSGDTLTITTA